MKITPVQISLSFLKNYATEKKFPFEIKKSDSPQPYTLNRDLGEIKEAPVHFCRTLNNNHIIFLESGNSFYMSETNGLLTLPSKNAKDEIQNTYYLLTGTGRSGLLFVSIESAQFFYCEYYSRPITQFIFDFTIKHYSTDTETWLNKKVDEVNTDEQRFVEWIAETTTSFEFQKKFKAIEKSIFPSFLNDMKLELISNTNFYKFLKGLQPIGGSVVSSSCCRNCGVFINYK